MKKALQTHFTNNLRRKVISQMSQKAHVYKFKNLQDKNRKLLNQNKSLQPKNSQRQSLIAG